MTRTEDNKKVKSEDTRREQTSKSFQKHTRTQHATKINNWKSGEQMKLEYSFNIGQNKMEQ